MRAVIDRTIYDTDTAEALATWCTGTGPSDWHWVHETLYRTSHGRYFLHGQGGGLSPWAESFGDMKGPGAGIQALSVDEAIDWAGRHGEVRLLVGEFGDHLREG